MADSTNGRSSFWTQADALLRKNLIFQASRVELLDEVQVRAINLANRYTDKNSGYKGKRVDIPVQILA